MFTVETGKERICILFALSVCIVTRASPLCRKLGLMIYKLLNASQRSLCLLSVYGRCKDTCAALAVFMCLFLRTFVCQH